MVTLSSPKRGQASEQRQHDSLSPRRPYPRYVIGADLSRPPPIYRPSLPVSLSRKGKSLSLLHSKSYFERPAIDLPTVTFIYQAKVKDECPVDIIESKGGIAGRI